MNQETFNPFGRPVEEVQLVDAPLVSVIAQVRFPVIAALHEIAGIASFQEAVKGTYPVMRPENQTSAVLGSDGNLIAGESVPLWRFRGKDDGWMATVAPSWIALETSTYTSRSDFLHRWTELLELFDSVGLAPAVFDRLGVRYVDQLSGVEDMANLHRFVNGAVLGAINIESDLGVGAELIGTVTQAHLGIRDAVMLARWGKVPPNAVAMPGVPPVDAASWFLDVDVFTEGIDRPFTIESVAAQSGELAQHAYSFFRWAVTEELLRSRGGSV